MRWRGLLRTRLRLDLLLTLRRRSLLLLPWWRCLLRTRLWLNLLPTLRRRCWGRLILRRRCLLRMLLGLNLLLTLRRSRCWLVPRWRRRLLRTRLRLNLLLARGRLISGRLIAIGLLLNWGRSWLRAGPTGGRRLIAIRLNILLGRGRLPGTTRLLLLHGVGWCGRWSGARCWSGARGNYGGDGFALRDRLGRGDDGGLAVIDGGELLAILGGLFAMLNLGGHRRNTLLARGG